MGHFQYVLAVFSPSSTNRLTTHDLGRFPSDSLFDRIARTVCEAGCLPRKELYEAWELARRVRRLFRGGRVVDLGAGHGLLGQIMLVLDDSSPSVVAVDPALPPAHQVLRDALCRTWPRLAGRVQFVSGSIGETSLLSTDVIVSSHACGALSDEVLDRSITARARVAILPCCHELRRGVRSSLAGWVDGPLAIDIARAVRLEKAGYRVWTQQIPDAITPKNRLLIGAPTADGGQP
jgi:hypothetical protein